LRFCHVTDQFDRWIDAVTAVVVAAVAVAAVAAVAMTNHRVCRLS
jgi:hypothetical protein